MTTFRRLVPRGRDACALPFVLFSALVGGPSPTLGCDVQTVMAKLAAANEHQQWAEFWVDEIPSEEAQSRGAYAEAMEQAAEAAAGCSTSELVPGFGAYLAKRAYAARSAFVRSTARRDR